eukprot:gene45860-47860_t
MRRLLPAAGRIRKEWPAEWPWPAKAFKRMDERCDGDFYEEPRLEQAAPQLYCTRSALGARFLRHDRPCSAGPPLVSPHHPW